MNIFLQNLIQTIRSLRTQGWQVAVSTVSLAVGIVCLTFSADWFWAETHYDWFRPDYRNLYVLEHTDSTKRGYEASHAWRELTEMKQQTEDGTFSIGFVDIDWGWDYTPTDKNNPQIMTGLGIDSCTGCMIGVRMLQGDLSTILNSDEAACIITDKAAMRLFGRVNVVGEMFKRIDDKHSLTIKGVCAADEGESMFNYDFLTRIRPWENNTTTYNLLSTMALVKTSNPEETTEKLNRYQRVGEQPRYRHIEPLRTYFQLRKSPLRNSYISFVEIYFYQIVFTLIAALLILSAVTNLIMVYTSICLARVREYALRRSMGASTWQNVQWIITGAMPAVIFGGLLSGVGMEWITKFVEIPWDSTFIFHCYACVLLLTLLLCTIGMAYPIHKMRRAYRASFLGHGDGGRSHQWLIIVQCVACAFLLFMSIGMQRQIYGMINADMGYEHKNMLRLHTGFANPEGYERYYDFSKIYDDLSQELRRYAGAAIVDVQPMRADIFNPNSKLYMALQDEHEHLKSENEEEYKRTEVMYVEIPFKAIDFFDIQLRNGQKWRQEDDLPNELQAYINEEAMKLIAPDGKLKMDYYIKQFIWGSGINRDLNMPSHWKNNRINIKDVALVRISDFFSEGNPIIFVGTEEQHKCQFIQHDAIYIKYAKGQREEAEATVLKVLKKFDVPEELYLLNTLDEHIAGVYKKETFIANLLTYLTVFSVAVTLAGVFSMLLYSLRLRRRSMAIHRVMGATFKDIFMPTLRPYLIYATLGAVAAYFPAYILMRKWMEYFHYGETPGVGLMLSILGGMVLIITLIIWWQVSLCMKEKPVEILKPES